MNTTFIWVSLVLVSLIIILSLAGTILSAIKVERNYGKSIKWNMIRLTSFYVILLIATIIGITWYVAAS